MTTPTPTPPSPPVRTERVKEILDLALERAVHERDAFVSGMCGDDGALRDEVLSLLRSLDSVGTILEPQVPAEPPPAEPLTGLRFGAYRVAERIGQGGMGVVYRAEDTRLGRTVAVKALPAHVAADPHRRARFQHEARLLAALNHPNIGAIHAVEDTARGPVLVLEYAPGETLAERLAKGALPLDEALPAARQILLALEAAHAAGIIHRDLKPANIRITADGVIKVLDFGIARMEQPPIVSGTPPTPDGSPPHPIVLTAPMGVLGTASYMSPEQARGRPVDRRTDLWAFGCVLYEMLTARRAFEGETLTDTLAALLRTEPDWTRLPPECPAHVRRLLRRCLEKRPDARQRDAGDARLDLDSAGSPVPDGPPPGGGARRRLALAGAFGAGALLVGGAAVVFWPRVGAPDRAAPARAVRFQLAMPPEVPLSACPGGSLGISPDGGTLVYSAGYEEHRRLVARRLDSVEWNDLPGTDGAITPFFSPDGAWLGFVSGDRLLRTPVAGGGAEVLVKSGVGEAGCAWAPDGSIVYTGPGGLLLLPAGGQPRPLIPPQGPDSPAPMHPEIVPGTDGVLFTEVDVRSKGFAGRIGAVRIGTGERSVVFDAACWPRFVPGDDSGASPDRLVFWQAGRILAAPFDRSALRIVGKAVPIAPALSGLEAYPMPRFAVSRGPGPGVLAYVPGNITYDVSRLAWFETGRPARIITESPSAVDTPRLSPDGARIAFIDSEVGAGDLWVHDLGRATNVRLTTTRRVSHPVWTPDGREIVVSGGSPDSNGIHRIGADGGSEPVMVWKAPGTGWAYPSSISPDGRTILITMVDNVSGLKDLYALGTDSAGPTRPLFPTRLERIWPRLSPDGALLAYAASETGTLEIYLHRYPDLGGKTLVSTGGGYRPTWAPDGRHLYYQFGHRIYSVEVEGTDPPRVSTPRVVLDHAPDPRFDVARDGRILMPHPIGDWGVQDAIDVVIGWDVSPGR